MNALIDPSDFSTMLPLPCPPHAANQVLSDIPFYYAISKILAGAHLPAIDAGAILQCAEHARKQKNATGAPLSHESRPYEDIHKYHESWRRIKESDLKPPLK